MLNLTQPDTETNEGITPLALPLPIATASSLPTTVAAATKVPTEEQCLMCTNKGFKLSVRVRRGEKGRPTDVDNAILLCHACEHRLADVYFTPLTEQADFAMELLTATNLMIHGQYHRIAITERTNDFYAMWVYMDDVVLEFSGLHKYWQAHQKDWVHGHISNVIITVSEPIVQMTAPEQFKYEEPAPSTPLVVPAEGSGHANNVT